MDTKLMDYRSTDPLFTIAIAGQLAGLHPRTLMLYEKASLIKPARTKTNRRHYSQVDIHKIKFIHYLAKEKRVNLAGIGAIFEILKLLGKEKTKITDKLFPDFKK